MKVKFKKEKHDSFRIGSVYQRLSGKLIYITSGSYIGGYDRISNHFHWRYLKKDGTLGKEGHGYGDTNIYPVDCKIQIKVVLK